MDNEIYKKVESFLDPIYKKDIQYAHRPSITLTFAQSLDGKISKPGQQILISGKESLAMTHRIRTYHDGIMVGIGTALVDDPQLNARFVSPEVSVSQPQPIVLDPYLKLSTSCKLIKNYKDKIGKQPWIVASSKGWEHNEGKALQLEQLGVRILVINTTEDRIPLSAVFERLKAEGIESLMVEGGSKIIQSCFETSFDNLIVTIAPMFIGSDGVPAVTNTENLAKLESVTYTTLGRDVVLAAIKG